MPTETRYIRAKEVSKEAHLVIPLDELRSFDNVTYTTVSGTSGVVYTIASGKEAYIRQALFRELSGNASEILLHTPTGSGLGVQYPLIGNDVVAWQLCDAACGPITSGITVQSPMFAGQICLLVQLDPKITE